LKRREYIAPNNMHYFSSLGPSIANAWIIQSHVLISKLNWRFLADSLKSFFSKFLLVQPNIGPFPYKSHIGWSSYGAEDVQVQAPGWRHHVGFEVVHERRLVECQWMHKTPTMASCTTKHLPRHVLSLSAKYLPQL
jgi:hypothetical protein